MSTLVRVPSRPDTLSPVAARADVLLTWLGVAGFVVTHRDQVLAVDPFFARPGIRDLLWGLPRPDADLAARILPTCALIVVSHAHYDHCLDVPSIARRTGAMVLGSRNTRVLMACQGVPTERLLGAEPGERFALPPFSISVWPGDHPWVPGYSSAPLFRSDRPPRRLRDYRMDTCLSYLVEIDGIRVYICNQHRLTSAPRAEVLCVSMARRASYYEALLGMVQPQLVIPMHWDDMFRPISAPVRPFWAPPQWGTGLRRLDPVQFQRVIDSSGARRVLVPEPLVAYRLGELLASHRAGGKKAYLPNDCALGR